MPIIPMQQTITVKRGGALDDWGNATPGVTSTLKCRVDEGSSVVNSRSQRYVNDSTEVSTARILLDGLADIKYTDIITFTNELGETIEKSPKEINVKRHVSGRPMLTEVLV